GDAVDGNQLVYDFGLFAVFTAAVATPATAAFTTLAALTTRAALFTFTTTFAFTGHTCLLRISDRPHGRRRRALSRGHGTDSRRGRTPRRSRRLSSHDRR